MIDINHYRVYDPDIPVDIGDDWIPFNANKLNLDIAYSSDFDLSDITLTAELQIYKIFGGWYDCRVKLNIDKSKQGIISIESEGKLPDFKKYDSEIYSEITKHQSRFRLLLEHNSKAQEVFCGFSQEEMPVWLGLINVNDPLIPVEQDRFSCYLPGEINKLEISFHYRCEIEAVAGELTLIYGRETIYQTSIELNEREGDIKHLIDPLPNGLGPPISQDQIANDYIIWINFKCSDIAQRSFRRTFSVHSIIPSGKIFIKNVRIDREPIFDFSEEKSFFYEIQPNIVSIAIETKDYDPLIECDPAKVHARIEINNSSHSKNPLPLLTKTYFDEVMFEKDGTGTAYIQIPELPFFQSYDKITMFVSVIDNRRHDKKEITQFHFIREWRADRPVIFTEAYILDNLGNRSREVSLDSDIVEISFQSLKNSELPILYAALLLCPRKSWSSRRNLNIKTNIYCYRIIKEQTSSGENSVVTFKLPRLNPDLFENDKVDVVVVTGHWYSGVYYEHIHFVDIFDIAQKFLEDVKGVKNNRRSWLGPRATPRPSISPDKLSGVHWVSKYPNSRSLNDLDSEFKEKAISFINMLKDNGASVDVNSTKRPPERAYLMHYAYKIANNLIKPGNVPKRINVDIVWNHIKALTAAKEMVSEYNIVYEPALNSRHIQGLAIDMTISNLPSKISLNTGGSVKIIEIGTRSASKNDKLWALAKEYFGVSKLPSDPPHWYYLK